MTALFIGLQAIARQNCPGKIKERTSDVHPRQPPAPRLVVLAGGLTLFGSNFVGDATLKAALQIGGGLLALVGLAWFFLTLRRR